MLYKTLELIKTLVYNHPNIGSVIVGDVTKLNTENIQYPAIVISQQTHNYNNSTETERFGLVLFCVDRLLSDESNKTMVQDWSNNLIISILKELEEQDYMVDYSNIEPFTKKFAALTAGAFCKFNLSVDADNCDRKYELVRSVNGMRGDVTIPTAPSYDDKELRNRIGTLENEISDKADKSEIPSVPSNVSAFRNDAGYITLSQVPKAHLDNYTEYGNSARIFANNTYIDVIDKELHLHSDEAGQSDLYLKPYSIEKEVRHSDGQATSYTSISTFSNSHSFKSYHNLVGDLSIYSSYNGIFIYNYDMSRNINSSLTFNTDGLQVNGNQVVAEWFGTQAEYDALTKKDNNIIYNIYED